MLILLNNNAPNKSCIDVSWYIFTIIPRLEFLLFNSCKLFTLNASPTKDFNIPDRFTTLDFNEVIIPYLNSEFEILIVLL